MARKQQSSLSHLYSAESPPPSFGSRLTAPPNTVSPATRGWLNPVLLASLFLGLVSAFVVAGNNVGAQSNRDLAGVSRTFISAIANGDTIAALAVCAESPEGQKILAAEQLRVFGSLNGPAVFDPQTRAIKLHTLNRLREELASDGVRWDNIEPLALGGVRARVLQPSLMKEPASLVWGHLYFSNANRVYEIEVTAWQCGDRFIIADVWDWAPVPVSPSDLESFAKARSRDFLDDRDEAPEDTKIIRPRRIFLAI